MDTNSPQPVRGRLWRSRWAAIGAAVAVTLGGGGIFAVQADNAPTPEPTLEEFVAMRQSSVVADTVEPAKTATRIDGGTIGQEALGAEVALLTGGATFFPISPYRAFDSRAYTDGLLLWGDRVYFDVLTDQFGKSRIPASAVAVTFNVTVTGTFGFDGFLTVYPAGKSNPGTSSINWFAPGLSLANGGVVSLGNIDGPGQIWVEAGFPPNTATDFIMDITGYYA